MKAYLSMAGAVLLGAMLACGDSPGAPSAAAPAPAPKPRAAAAYAPDGGTVERAQYVYVYNPVAKRDPFRSFSDDEPRAKGDDVSASCNEPLCQYDLEQLNLVAVVSGDANPVAMLEDPEQVGHIVRRNAKVGKQGGKVTQILRDCIEVTEFFKTPEGKVSPNKLNVCIKHEVTAKRAFDLLNGKDIE